MRIGSPKAGAAGPSTVAVAPVGPALRREGFPPTRALRRRRGGMTGCCGPGAAVTRGPWRPAPVRPWNGRAAIGSRNRVDRATLQDKRKVERGLQARVRAPLVAVAAMNFGDDMPALHQPFGIGEATPSKCICLLRLLETQSESSPTRWTWICNLVKQLKTECGNIDLNVISLLNKQADVLEDRLAAHKLAADASSHCPPSSSEDLEQPTRAKRTLFETTACKAGEGRAQRLRMLRENPASPQPPLCFNRDTLLRAHVGGRRPS